MKYQDKSFSVGGYGKEYSENWEQTFMNQSYKESMRQLSNFMGMIAKILTAQEQRNLDRSTRK